MHVWVQYIGFMNIYVHCTIHMGAGLVCMHRINVHMHKYINGHMHTTGTGHVTEAV